MIRPESQWAAAPLLWDSGMSAHRRIGSEVYVVLPNVSIVFERNRPLPLSPRQPTWLPADPRDPHRDANAECPHPTAIAPRNRLFPLTLPLGVDSPP